jgi:Ca2+-binding EF-hand superfamily protein
MLGDLQELKASYYFDLIDEDDNGLVDARDFEIRAERMAEARNVSDPEARAALRDRVMTWWEHLCALADTDDDDRVTREEWETYWEALQVSVRQSEEDDSRTLRSLERAARGTFQAMNTTGGEEVTEEEYAEWLQAWGVPESKAAFERLDRDGTGGLTEQDLVMAVKEFYLSNDPQAPGNVLYGELPW